MSAPAAIANAVADALGRDDVELPLTPPRVWALLHADEEQRVKPVPFEYVRAASLEEALAALADGGDEAKPIAGGQSLVPALNLRLVRPTRLVDLNRAGLDGVSENGALTVGATTRQAALADVAALHPLVRAALPFVGHFVTRNRGTVGGSIAHADGAAELPLCLTALDGTVVAEGPGGRREIAAADFFVTHFTDDAPSRESSSSRRAGRSRRRPGERLSGAVAAGRGLRPVDGRGRADARRRRRIASASVAVGAVTGPADRAHRGRGAAGRLDRGRALRGDAGSAGGAARRSTRDRARRIAVPPRS